MTPLDEASAFLASRCFHQSLRLPAVPGRGPLRVTFATTRNFSSTSAPPVLFATPIGASRLLITELDHLASKIGVRVICIDRPDFGGSDHVPLEKRVDTWLEAVPAVLARLGVEHVALLSHSAGTVYTLNTLLKLPHLLDPRRPYVALVAPWVHPDHSQSSLWTFVDKLPASWIGNWHSVQLGLSTVVEGSSGLSSGVLDGAKDIFGSQSDKAERADKVQSIYGVAPQVRKLILSLRSRYFRAEATSGISQEALICMKKGSNLWGAYEDLPGLIENLTSSPPRGLVLHAFFSESDVMIGKGGQKYFEDCWRAFPGFASTTIPSTSHDSVILPTAPTLEMIFKEITGAVEVQQRPERIHPAEG